MSMRKIIYLLVGLIFITGCGDKKQVDIIYDSTYYQVASPYKEAVGSYSISSYDKNEVESMLMNLSTNYFKTNNSLYQQGQYLDSEELKTLINLYNETEKIKVDNVEIDPKYIVSIYEQNYLTTNNNLKGISLAIVVTNKQYYNQNKLYKIVDEKIVLDYAISKANELVKYMYAKEELKNTRIVVGIYLQSNNTLKGSFKYIGESNKDSIKLQNVNYNYQSLDSNYIMNNDTETYNSILAIKQSLNDYNTLYLNPIGLYKDKTLVRVDLTVNKSYFSNVEILSLARIITSNFGSFDSNIQINVYFKSNNSIKAYIVKKEEKIETYILEE